MKTISTDVFQIKIPDDFDEPVIDPIGFKATMTNTGAKIQEPLLDAVLCKVSELDSDTYKGKTLQEKYEDWCLSLNYKAEKLSFEKTEVNGYEAFIVNAHTDAPWMDKHLTIRYFQAALFLGDGYFLDIRTLHEKIEDNALADWVLEAFESVEIMGDTAVREKAFTAHLLAQQEKNNAYQAAVQQRQKEEEEAKKKNLYEVAIPQNGEELFQVGDFDFEFVPEETKMIIGQLSKDLQITLKAKTSEIAKATTAQVLDDYRKDGVVTLTIPAKGIYNYGVPTGRFEFQEEKTNAPLFLTARSEGFDYRLAFSGTVVLDKGWVLLKGEMTKSYHNKSFPIAIAKKFDVGNLQWSDYSFSSMAETETADPLDVRFLALNKPQFSQLPDAIFNYINLESLTISDTRNYHEKRPLSPLEIQAEIGRLKHLNTLRLNGYDIKELPDGIAELQELEQLSIINCNLQSIPGGIFQLPKLKHIWLSGNALTQLPEAIKLPELKNISLDKNQFKTLPEAIAKQPKLKSIDLQDNPLENLPAVYNTVKEIKLSMEDKLRLLSYDYQGADGKGLVSWDDTVFWSKNDPDLLPELEKVVQDNELTAHKGGLIGMVKKSLLFNHSGEEDYAKVGNHRFGGVPDLPENIPYPRFGDNWREGKDDYIYEFIAQINCESIAHLQDYLPRTGTLFFFLETIHSVYGGNHQPGKVMYVEDNARLVSGKRFQFTKEDYSEMFDAAYKSFKVRAEKANSAPSLYANYVNTHLFKGDAAYLKEDAGLLDELYDLFETPINKQNPFQYAVNAYGFTQHEHPELQASLAKKGNPEDWVTLLIVGSEGDMQWGDAGDLFFVIHKSDLAKGDFSNVFITMESS